MKMNKLGKTGIEVSRIAFGGIVVMDSTPDHAAKTVSDAIDYGINYFDVAPAYGNAEEMLGPALEPYRKNVNLACKCHLRDAENTKRLLEESLKKLKTDYFDVYQLHALVEIEKDVDPAFAKGGAMEVILKAKEEGIIRNIGFSAHNPDTALEAMRRFDFDTVLYPVNFCTHFMHNFEEPVIKEAKKRDMGIIAIKALAKQQWQNEKDKERHSKCWYEPIEDPEIARLALSWTLDQGVSTAVPPGEEKLFRLCMELLPKCEKPGKDDLEKLENFAKQLQPIF